MSQLGSNLASPVRGLPAEKPGPNIYTVLLILALIAIVIGCVFLFLEIQEYGGLGAVKGLAAGTGILPEPDVPLYLQM